jgi:hypothetical protein
MAMPSAVAARAEQVVQRHARRVEAAGDDRSAEQGEQERLDPDEVRCQPDDPGPLGQRLPDQPEPVLLEVSEPAVDQPR